VAILLGLEAGLRTFEVTHLRISDVWFNGDVKPWLHIPENFNKKCKEGMIPLTRNLVEALRLYVPIRLSWLKEGELDGWLIFNSPGKRKSDQALTKVA
jgi:site-specific recombinase XerD